MSRRALAVRTTVRALFWALVATGAWVLPMSIAAAWTGDLS